MLTLQKTNDAAIISVSTSDKPVEDLLDKEWLLTNDRGSYASSTIVCCNTRRYHGLLVGSLNPLARRIMGLANCLEMVILDGTVFNLSTFEFNEKFSPEGFKYIRQFRRDIGVHFDYQLHEPGTSPCGAVKRNKPSLRFLSNKSQDVNPLVLTKSIYLLRDTDTVALVYDFLNVGQLVEFVLRPFIGLRDFHVLQKSYAPLRPAWLGNGLLIRHDIPDSSGLFVSCPSMSFRKDQQWWFNFVYRNDKERGQDYTEDLWSPGFFKCRLDSATRIVFWASLCSASIDHSPKFNWCQADIETVREDLCRHQESLKSRLGAVTGINLSAQSPGSPKRAAQHEIRDTRYETLCSAADQFIAKRQVNGKHRPTIVAGFPWFADWGRDAFVALPGLLLLTANFDQARLVLTTFAQAVDEGMIPNRFDDHSDTAYFNSIDASLWFINAAFQYLYVSGDSKTFSQELLPTIRWIIDSYHSGTRFGIHADADGLITGGNNETQLTWMDAKCDGVAFTARYGKAVEINALWYSSLCHLAQYYTGRDIEAAKHYESLSEKVGASFRELFWNEAVGYLNDCVLPDGSVDASLRPNQIFAVSLPFSALSARHQRRVVEVVQKNLLTPYGLRTLNVEDSCYKGQYTGSQRQRDEAYHQGTVWPYLIGPFVEAYLKVNAFSRKSKKKAAEFIQPLLHHLTEDGCLGQISEIFDGDTPHRPRGCIAQAWSVAELIRAHRLINS